MVEDPQNTIEARGGARSREKGDVPVIIRRRHRLGPLDEPGLAFLEAGSSTGLAFLDRGGVLTTRRQDPTTACDMVAVAQHRGWTQIRVAGEVAFRREAWWAATAVGIKVRGYRPNEQDRRDVQSRERAASTRRRGEASVELRPADLGKGEWRRPDPVKIVRIVVQARIAEPAIRAQILIAARERLARGLEQSEPVMRKDQDRRPPARERAR